MEIAKLFFWGVGGGETALHLTHHHCICCKIFLSHPCALAAQLAF